MPPVVPPYKLQARRRMRQAMLPEVAAAHERQQSMRRQPMNPGAEQQQKPQLAEQAMASDQRAAAQARLMEGLGGARSGGAKAPNFPNEQGHPRGNPIIGRLPVGYGPGGQGLLRPRPKQPRPVSPAPGDDGILLQRMRRRRF